MPTTDRRVTDVLAELERHGDPRNVEGMARYGIRSARAYGAPAPVIARLARGIGRDHRLAARLWRTGVLEARALAALIDDARLVDGRQMERWAADFDSWAICDHVCGKLFDRAPLAWRKARAWSRSRREFVKRAAFALVAWLAVHDKQAPDEKFLAFLPVIEREAADDRNMVKKAVNWALRQIGKRNPALNRRAIACARRLRRQRSAAARWVAADALRELRSSAVQARMRDRRLRMMDIVRREARGKSQA
jgi:3-methyladenine DNA glycosylase AlkD